MSWNQCLNWETSFAKSPTILLPPSLGLADRILALITQSQSRDYWILKQMILIKIWHQAFQLLEFDQNWFIAESVKEGIFNDFL